MKRYMVNEIFYSIQGEGLRAGTAAIFVRFSKCNLACNLAEHGFDCDTEFETGKWYSLAALVEAITDMQSGGWIIFTGGEPALQLDHTLITVLRALGYKLAIETNGTKTLPRHLDWVCVSPKTDVVVNYADEVKCVVGADQVPDHRGITGQWLISPAFKGDEPDPDAVAWCVQWVLDHPRWRLSYQLHKTLGVR